MKPTYEEFKDVLEESFDQKLTSDADVAAKDYWENWDQLRDQLGDGSISVNVDALALGQKLPEYRKHHPIKGLAKVVFVGGIVTLFFNWKIGLGVIGLGIVINIYGSTVQTNTSSDFTADILRNIKDNNLKEGMVTLCSHYIAGTIELSGIQGNAHWPQHPSNVLTGQTGFVTS